MASITSSTALGKPSVLISKPALPTKKFNSTRALRDNGASQRRSTTVVNVATPQKPTAVETRALEKKSPYHVAWSSIKQYRFEGELVVEGEIPEWLNGTYIRNGPGIWNLGEYEFRHLFDGYATLCRLSFEDGRLSFSHRQLESEAYKAAMKSNKVCYREWSEVPKPESFLAHIGDLANPFSGKSLTDNANTSVVMLGDGRVVCSTETQKSTTIIDPDTLETLGKLQYTDNLGGLIHAAHPIVTDTELCTLLPDLIRPGYQVVKMLSGTNERILVGRVDCRGGPSLGWVHGFAATENYVVVPEMPLRYCAPNLLRAEQTPLYKLEWHPESKAYYHIVCKASGKVVSSVEVPLYVTFHFINAYEEKDEDGRVTSIVVDCCEHTAGYAILDGLRLDNLRAHQDMDTLADAQVARFRIPMDGSPYGTMEAALDPELHGRGIDMCSFNKNYLGKFYQYAYSCGAQRPCNFPNTLTKLDLVNKTAKNWHEPGALASEPYFIPRPGATEEDDGVVVSIVSQKCGDSYALLLDGSSFDEIARAKMPYGIPYGLHGGWVPRKN